MSWHNINQNTDEWLNLRLGRFTASEFKSLFAKKSTVEYQKLIASKAYERIHNKRVEEYQFSNMWTERGHELEDEARMKFTSETFLHVFNGGFFTKDHNVGASPDGLIGNDALLEIKCPALHTHINYIKGDKIPSAYFWQVVGQSYVSGRPMVYFVSYHPDAPIFIVQMIVGSADKIRLAEAIKAAEKDVQEAIKLIK